MRSHHARSARRAVDVLLLVVALVVAAAWGRELLTSRQAVAHPAAATGLASPTTTPTADEPLVAVLGDSFSGGSAQGGVGRRGWPRLLADRLHFALYLDTVAGSGYCVDGARTGGAFPTRAPSVVDVVLKPDVVVVFAARNDAGRPAGSIRAAEQKTLEQIKAGAPGAQVLVIGPVWSGDVPPASYVAAAKVEQATAKAAGVAYLDGLTDPWFKGHADKLGAGGAFPTDAGHVLLADRIEPALRAALARSRV